MSASGRVRRRMPCQAPCEAASGVRLRAGTLSTPSTDISTSRIQTGAPGAMRMARASCGAPSAYSASTRSRTWPTWRSPAVRAPGRNSQWRWAGVRAGGALASQPAARRGGMLREGSWLRIMPRAAPGPCGVMPQAGRRRGWAYNGGHGKVRISKLMSERGLCSRREADGYIERGWVRVDGVVVSELGARAFPRPGHHAGTRRAGARPRASRY